MRKQTVIQALNTSIQAYKNCNDLIKRSVNEINAPQTHKWRDYWEDRIKTLNLEYLPSGSGFDSGCLVDIENSGPRSIKITTDFHHMDEYGFYNGWKHYILRVTPDFEGFTVECQHLTQEEMEDFGDYLIDTFHEALSREVKE